MQLKAIRVVTLAGTLPARLVTVSSDEGKRFGARIEDLVGVVEAKPSAADGTVTFQVNSRDLTAAEIRRIRKTGESEFPFEIRL